MAGGLDCECHELLAKSISQRNSPLEDAGGDRRTEVNLFQGIGSCVGSWSVKSSEKAHRLET